MLMPCLLQLKAAIWEIPPMQKRKVGSSRVGVVGKTLDDVEVRPYDFKRPERVSKDQMRALENASRELSAVTSAQR